MPRLSRNKLSSENYNKILSHLISSISRLKNDRDVAGLFEGLFTKIEKLMIAKRLAIAMLLEKGITYPEISRRLKFLL